MHDLRLLISCRFVKFLLQWAACSAAGQRMTYVAWNGGNGGAAAEKFEQIKEFAASVAALRGATVGDVVMALERVSQAYQHRDPKVRASLTHGIVHALGSGFDG